MGCRRGLAGDDVTRRGSIVQLQPPRVSTLHDGHDSIKKAALWGFTSLAMETADAVGTMALLSAQSESKTARRGLPSLTGAPAAVV
jgi:hypothetical protein